MDIRQYKGVPRLFLAAGLVLFLALTILCTPARAADVDIMFSDPSVLTGETAVVNVYSTGDVAGVNLTMVYDTDYLQYTGYSGGLGNASVSENGGTITVVDYHGSGAGRFSLNLSFTAKTPGSSSVRPTACSVSDASGDLMSVEYASHSSAVTVRSASSNCDLSALYIDPGTLSPAFSSGVTDYSATVPHSATWLAVSPSVSDGAARYTVSGHEWLDVGTNYVTVTVTAGSGAQKTYTIAVTREAAPPPAEPQGPRQPQTTPDNRVDTSPEKIPRFMTLPDGSEMEIAVFEAGKIPGGFVGVELPYQGETLQAIRSEDGTVTAVYGRGGGEWGEGFYVFDPDSGSALPMDLLTVEGGTWLVLDAGSLSAAAPEGTVPGTWELNGKNYRCYIPENGGDYVILCARGPLGEAGLYRYDTLEKTMQRWGLSPDSAAGDAWEILDPSAAGIETPEGYMLIDLPVGEKTVRGYVPASGEATEYFVLCAARNGGEPGLYTYDLLEKTFQRFSLMEGSREISGEDGAENRLRAAESAAEAAEARARHTAVGLGIALAAVIAAWAVTGAVLCLRRKRRTEK